MNDLNKMKALLLAGTLALTTVGCGKKSNESEDKYTANQLANTFVATVDDEYAILQYESHSDVLNFVNGHHLAQGEGQRKLAIIGEDAQKNIVSVNNADTYATKFSESIENQHSHYLNILTGAEYATDEDCTAIISNLEYGFSNFTYANIEIIQQFSDFLTAEEILKAQKGELNKEELTKIVIRVIDEVQEKTEETSFHK